MQNASRAPVAAVCSGAGAAVMLGLRFALPTQLDAFGQHAADRGFLLTATVLAFVFGAACGLAAALLPRRAPATLLATFVFSPAAWGVLAWFAVQQSTQSALSSGQALTVGLLMTPVYLVVAALSLVGFLVLGAVLTLGLFTLARVLDAAAPTTQWGLSAVWVVNVLLFVGALRSLPPEVAPFVPIRPDPPKVAVCETSPFESVAKSANLRGPSRRIEAEHVYEFTVIGPSAWTDGELATAASTTTSATPPCRLDGAEWTVRFVPATPVFLTLHFKAKPRKGEDPVMFEAMLTSQLGSAFASSLHLSPEGFFTASVTEGLGLLPPDVPKAFTCEGGDADLVCTAERIEVRRAGVVPKLAGVKAAPR